MERLKANMLKIAFQLEAGAEREEITSQQSQRLGECPYHRQGLLGSKLEH